jgi:hypothetical protein
MVSTEELSKEEWHKVREFYCRFAKRDNDLKNTYAIDKPEENQERKNKI